MSLPIYKDSNTNLMLLQTNWATQLNPLLANSISQGVAITSVPLVTGSNVINHKLGRMQQGWFLTDIDAAATIYRSAPFNTYNLTLTSSAPCVVNLWMF